MASKANHEKLKTPSEMNADIVKISENNGVSSALPNGTDKLLGFEKNEHVENHVDHQNDSVNSQTVKILSGKDISDEQAKILSENILVESSKGKYECSWHKSKEFHVFLRSNLDDPNRSHKKKKKDRDRDRDGKFYNGSFFVPHELIKCVVFQGRERSPPKTERKAKSPRKIRTEIEIGIRRSLRKQVKSGKRQSKNNNL